MKGRQVGDVLRGVGRELFGREANDERKQICEKGPCERHLYYGS